MRPIDSTKVRFGLVGVANTALDAGCFLAVSAFGAPLVVANLISTSAGMALSFALNRTFTFRAGGQRVRRQAVLFFVVTVTGLWGVQGGVILLVTNIHPGVPLIVAKAAGIAVGLVWNFLLYHHVVFRSRTEAGRGR